MGAERSGRNVGHVYCGGALYVEVVGQAADLHGKQVVRRNAGWRRSRGGGGRFADRSLSAGLRQVETLDQRIGLPGQPKRIDWGARNLQSRLRHDRSGVKRDAHRNVDRRAGRIYDA